MKVAILSTSDFGGGAARSAYRIYKGLKNIGVYSKMLVQEKETSDPSVIGPSGMLEITRSIIFPLFEYLPLMFFRSKNQALHSPAIVSTLNFHKLDKFNPDIVQLQWINRGFVKPEDLLKIKQPLVWRFADYWPFCGAEHLPKDEKRFIEGYGWSNRPDYESGFDINRWVFNRKKKVFSQIHNLHIVTPSRWLADLVKKSYLCSRFPVTVIPNGLDHKIFKPIDKKVARGILNIPPDGKYIVFGALNPLSDPNKGFNYLYKAVKAYSRLTGSRGTKLLIFGSSKPEKPIKFGFPTFYLDKLSDDYSLAIAYSAADIMIVPSKIESFGQTALESMACGTPVLCFSTSGLKDVVTQGATGYLARPYSFKDLTAGLRWLMANKKRLKSLSRNARRTVVKNFTLESQARQYLNLYKKILSE